MEVSPRQPVGSPSPVTSVDSQVNGINLLDHLSKEIIQEIILPKLYPSDLVSVSLTCQRFKQLIEEKEDVIWNDLFSRLFLPDIKVPEQHDLKPKKLYHNTLVTLGETLKKEEDESLEKRGGNFMYLLNLRCSAFPQYKNLKGQALEKAKTTQIAEHFKIRPTFPEGQKIINKIKGIKPIIPESVKNIKWF